MEVRLPKQCRHCGGNLPQKPGQAPTAGEPRRHQVTEVPPVKAHLTEYQFPNVVCGHCGKATRAPLPEEIGGDFGPQLTALIAYWTVVCRLPRRLVEAMLADVLGIEISLGSTQKAWEEVSPAVEQPVQQWQEQLPREAVLNGDETGWRTNGEKRWIWALVANQFVFYVGASTRGAEVLVSLLGAVFRGILCSDRWVVYWTYHSGRMQLCWAHLKRNILGIADYACRAVSNRKMILNCETKYFFCERTPPIFNDGFSSLLPQAVGAVGKWESCLWISTFPPPIVKDSFVFCVKFL
jgi:transposase